MPARCWIAPRHRPRHRGPGHRLAGSADLDVVGGPAEIGDRARGADGATERVGERLDDRETLGRAGIPAPAGDDDRRVGETGAT